MKLTHGEIRGTIALLILLAIIAGGVWLCGPRSPFHTARQVATEATTLSGSAAEAVISGDTLRLSASDSIQLSPHKKIRKKKANLSLRQVKDRPSPLSQPVSR